MPDCNIKEEVSKVETLGSVGKNDSFFEDGGHGRCWNGIKKGKGRKERCGTFACGGWGVADLDNVFVDRKQSHSLC